MNSFSKKYYNLFLAFVSFLIVLIIDGVIYYIPKSFDFYTIIDLTKEIIVIIALIFSTMFWKKLEEKKTDVSFLLKNIIAIVIVLLTVISVKLTVFSGELYSDFFPQKAINLKGLVLGGLLGLSIIILLPSIVIILKNLYLYKRKKFTPTYFYIYIVFAIISSLIISFNQDPTEAKLDNKIDFNTIINYITIGYSFILSFRHKWITYLSKSQKYSYAAGSFLFVPAIILLLKPMQIPLTSFSIFLQSFSNIIWFFLASYSISSTLFLWLQLPTANIFEKKMGDLDLIHRSSQKLNQMSVDKDLFKEIVIAISEIISTDDVWFEKINSMQESTSIYSLHASDNSIQDFIKYSKHEKISKKIIEEKKSILFADLKFHKNFKPYYKWKNNLRCLIAAPLFSSQKKIIGVLYITNEIPYAYDLSDQAIVESYVFQASLFIENARLLQATLKQERFKQELKIAKDVQLNLLPKTLPKINGIEISAESLTAYEVGGDFYDFFQYKDGQYGFVLGDVSGKGTQAAFYMAEFKGIIQSLALTCNSAEELAILSNKILFPNIETKSFITAIIAKFDDKHKKLNFVRAGHSNPVCINHKNNSNKEIYSTGIGLGLDKGLIFNKTLKQETIKYDSEEIIFFYTDGLSELMNHKNEELSFKEIINIFLNRHNYNIENIKQDIMQTVFNYLKGSPLSDDLTFLIIKFK